DTRRILRRALGDGPGDQPEASAGAQLPERRELRPLERPRKRLLLLRRPHVLPDLGQPHELRAPIGRLPHEQESARLVGRAGRNRRHLQSRCKKHRPSAAVDYHAPLCYFAVHIFGQFPGSGRGWPAFFIFGAVSWDARKRSWTKFASSPRPSRRRKGWSSSTWNSAAAGAARSCASTSTGRAASLWTTAAPSRAPSRPRSMWKIPSKALMI